MNSKRFQWVGVVAVALAGLMILSACNVLGGMTSGSGTVVTEDYDFTDFDEVSLSYAFDGTITQGDAYSVSVRIDDNLVDKLVVEQVGNRVNIGLEPNTLVNQATMEVDITLPELTWLEISGASQAQLNGLTTESDFTGHASGASRIHGDITAGDLDLEASGASTISLAGTAADVRADASGASTIDLEELSTSNADAVASGASTVIVNTGGQLNADASGGSTIRYLGNPTLGNIEESGASNVEPR